MRRGVRPSPRPYRPGGSVSAFFTPLQSHKALSVIMACTWWEGEVSDFSHVSRLLRLMRTPSRPPSLLLRGRAPVKLGALCRRSRRGRAPVKLAPLHRRSRGGSKYDTAGTTHALVARGRSPHV